MSRQPDDTPAPAWLAELGLPSTDWRTIDERAVRRAYAQRLRSIDQATQAAAFQSLREAYDTALGELRQRAATEEIADQTAGQAPVPAATGDTAATSVSAQSPDAPPTPAALAPTEVQTAGQTDASPDVANDPRRQVFDQAQAVYDEFARQAGTVFADEAQARAALQRALDDERLTSLDARTAFEWQVGCLIMNGWHPGHECLFGPACDLFDWERDRRRLVQFGELGAALDQAIQERLIFFQQSAVDVELQRQLIRRMRSDEPPSDAALNAELPSMVMLMQRHPNWLPAITSLPNLRTWHARHQQLHAADAAARPRPPSPRPAESTATRPWMPLVFLLAGLGAIANFLGNGRHAGTAPATTATPAARVSPYTQPLPLPAARDSTPQNLFLTTGTPKVTPPPAPAPNVDRAGARQPLAPPPAPAPAQTTRAAAAPSASTGTRGSPPARVPDGLLDLVPHDAAYKIPKRPEPVRAPPIVGIPAMPMPGAGSGPPTTSAPAAPTQHPAGSGGLNSHPAPDTTLPTLNERWQRPSYELVPRESPFVPPTSLIR